MADIINFSIAVLSELAKKNEAIAGNELREKIAQPPHNIEESIGGFYIQMDELEQAGLVRSEIRDTQRPERSFRKERFFEITERGRLKRQELASQTTQEEGPDGTLVPVTGRKRE